MYGIQGRLRSLESSRRLRIQEFKGDLGVWRVQRDFKAKDYGVRRSLESSKKLRSLESSREI